MGSIAIITARGGSKRIPKKNIKNFCGKPIIAYSIEAAVNSNMFDEVMVSTDSEEIAAVAKRYGAKVPFFRSIETSTDFATTEDALIEVLQRYKENSKEYDIVCCIYPTAPFITPEKIKHTFNILKNDSEKDSVIPVVKFSFPPQRALIEVKGKLQYQYPEYENARSQDLMPIYHDAGQFYLCKTDSLIKYHNLITPHSAAYFLPEEEVQDIDNMSDWRLAEQKFQNMRGASNVPSI